MEDSMDVEGAMGADVSGEGQPEKLSPSADREHLEKGEKRNVNSQRSPNGAQLLAEEPLDSDKREAVQTGPVYRRKLKKLATKEGTKPPSLEQAVATPEPVKPEQKSEGSAAKSLEKSESVKKRKPGFQKKDKLQEDAVIVKNEGEFAIGDLVWTKLKGHPWWPSQIFDPEKGTKKAKKLQKPGHLLIAFFGDETFAWHKPDDLIPFEANLEVKSKQPGGGKLFQDAIEGAEEELERRKAAARGIIIEDPEEREERLRKERAETEKAAIAAYDPDSILQYVRALASQPLDGPSDEPSRIQVLAYRSVVHHEEKEHPAKAGVLPGWRPILKEPKRKPKVKAPKGESSDEDVPILSSPKNPKPAKTPGDEKTPKIQTGGDGAEPGKKRGWPKGKPRGKKTATEASLEHGAAAPDGSEKKRRRKNVKTDVGETNGASPSAKFDQLVAAIDDIEGRLEDQPGENDEPGYFTSTYAGGGTLGASAVKEVEETKDGKFKGEKRVQREGRVNGEENGLGAPKPEGRKAGEPVVIRAPKIKRATREEAGEELGALLDKLRAIAQAPQENDPDSKVFRGTATKYVDYRRYQIARSKARFQRAFNYASGVSPRPPVSTAVKRKALQSLARVPGEGRPLKKRKDDAIVKKEEKRGDGVEKPKVKRVRKNKEKVAEADIKEKESEKKEGDGASTDEDVPLHKRMKFSPAESALPPRKQVGTATAADRIAENRRRMLGVREASERARTAAQPSEDSAKASKAGTKASEKASEAPAKPFEPLALFMRFPEQFAVPSEVQLKANFVRFGELATYRGATRVLPHKSSAQVVFKRSEDAESAFKYCRGNAMFGSPKIRYELREVVFKEAGKKGRVNSGESPRGPNKLTYDELLKGPAKPGPPQYRPISARPTPPSFPPAGVPPPAPSGNPAGGAGTPKRSILKDPRRNSQVHPSLLRSSAMETLLKPPILKPPPPPAAPPPPAYTSPRGPHPPPYPPTPTTPYTSQPVAYPSQQPSYSAHPPAYPSQSMPARGQSAPYAVQSSGAAPAYGPRPPAYGPNQSHPPAYGPRPSVYQPPAGRAPFNHIPSSYESSRPGYTAPFNHPPAPQPPLPPYPRGAQQPAQAPPLPYGQPSPRSQATYTAIYGTQRPAGGSLAGQTLPPPPPPMPAAPQLVSEVQKLASMLNVMNAQNVQNLQAAQKPQTLPPPPAPQADPRRQVGVDRPQGAVPVVQPNPGLPSLSEPDAQEMHQERIGELIGEAAGPEDESFRDMLEQLLTQAAELQANSTT